MMGSKPQGSAMGWLTTAGGLGRIMFPLIAGSSIVVASYVNFVTAFVSAIAVIACRFLFKNVK